MTKTHAQRGTWQIGRNQAERVLHAVRYATDRGRPLNAHVALNFHRLGIEEDAATKIFRVLRAKFARSWRYRDSIGAGLGTLDDIHVHENPFGKRNVHWALHIPDERWTWATDLIDRILRKMLRLDDLGDALLIEPAHGPGGLAKYLLKGVEPAYAHYFHISNPAPQGFISGRGRTGASRSIGKAARDKAGWKRKRRGGPASRFPT